MHLDPRHRIVDDGGPLWFGEAPFDEDALYAAYSSTCGNPNCNCVDLLVTVAPMIRKPDGFEAGPERLKLRVDTVSGEVIAGENNGFTDEERDWLCEEFGDDLVQDYCRRRFARDRSEVGDPRYAVPAPDLQYLVAYEEVFPWGIDLTVDHDGRTYLLDDQYCLKPGCPCDEVTVVFFDGDDGKDVGAIRAPISDLNRVTVIDGNKALLRKLWSVAKRTYCGEDEDDHDELLERHRQMREFADRPPQRPVLVQKTEKIGRNDPCHCGSGKKYKKCCLRADEASSGR